MVTYVVGDLFSSPAQVLVNTVNTVGVMGKGLAYTFKRVYPEMYQEYKRYCDNQSLTVGKLHLYKSPQKWILNFPTKKHWRGKSKIEFIEAGLKKFRDTYEEKEIKSISFPMLGCENGGLEWSRVQTVMERYLEDLPSELEVYIHLFRPDLLSFPDYRKVARLKKQLQGELDFVSFGKFWESLDRTIIAEFGLSKATLKQIWTCMNDGQYLLANEIGELLQPTTNSQVNHIDLPKLHEPAGYVYVVKLPEGTYRIGRTTDPAKRIRPVPRANVVAVFGSQDVKQAVRIWQNRYAGSRVAPRKQLYRLDKSQVATIREDAARRQNKTLALKLTEYLKSLPFVQPVLISDRPKPTSGDAGIQLIPTVKQSQKKQKGMAL